MSNMSSFIKQHNRNILSSSPNSKKRSCNCRNKDNCPLAGSCLKMCIVYRVAEESLARHILNTITLNSRTEQCAKSCEMKLILSNTYFPQRLTFKYLKICIRIFFITSFLLFNKSE